MSDLRQAAQQALEALEEATTYTSSPSWSPSMTSECNAAITALRAALTAAVAEPLTAQAFDELCAENDRLIKYADHCNELIAAYKEAAQTAEPVLKYTGLFEYAHEHRLNYNELCKVVREACSAPKEQA